MSAMAKIDTLFRNLRLPDGTPSAIGVADGRIAAIGPGAGTDASAHAIDLDGALVLPGFVEGHVHLDTSFHGDTWRPYVPYAAGFNVRERVAIQHRNMAAAAPMAQRARNQLALCIANGATAMRSHVMVDAGLADEALPAGHNLQAHIADLEKRMRESAGNLEFEEAARLRDEIKRLEATELMLADDPFARQQAIEEKAGRFGGKAAKSGKPAGAGASGKVRKNTLDEMTIRRTEIPLGRPPGRSSGGKPGTRTIKGKGR